MIDEEIWILEAIHELKIPLEEFQKCSPQESDEIFRNIKAQYVSVSRSHWWFSLKNVVVGRHFADGGFRHILEYVPSGNPHVWFVPDIGERYNLAYQALLTHTIDVIGNCNGFPYYISSLDYSWLLAESDDDYLYYCKSPVTFDSK